MAKKGQTFLTYSYETKMKAIEMRLQGMTNGKVAKELGIPDVKRIKVWMRKYRELGEFGLLDQRGKRQHYVDQERYVKKLELENDVLKKWLEITKQEVYLSSIGSLTNCGRDTPSRPSVKN